LSRPAELTGTWSWVETDGTTAIRTYGITPADQAARFSSTAATLRTGWLQLTGALGPDPGTGQRPAAPTTSPHDRPEPDPTGPDGTEA